MIFKKIILILTLTISSFAYAGRDSGGGDPIAAEFSDILSKVAIFVTRNPKVVPQVDPSQFTNAAVKVRNSLNSIILDDDLVEVVEKRPKVSKKKIKKAGVFDLKTGRVLIHRDSWNDSSDKEKVILTAMEGLGLSSLTTDRYTLSYEAIGANYSEIINLNKDLLEIEIPVPTNSKFSGVARVLWSEVDGTSLYKCTNSNASLTSCKAKSGGYNYSKSGAIEKHKVDGKNTWLLLRPGFYKLKNNITLEEKVIQLKDKDVYHLPFVKKKVVFSKHHGPGSVKVYIKPDTRNYSFLNRTVDKIVKDSSYDFPLKLEEGRLSNLSDFQNRSVYFYEFCKAVVKARTLDSIYINTCQNMILNKAMTRQNYKDLFARASGNKIISLNLSSVKVDKYDGRESSSTARSQLIRSKLYQKAGHFIGHGSGNDISEDDFYVFHIYDSSAIQTYEVNLDGRVYTPHVWLNSTSPSFTLSQGNYIAEFENESGETIEVPFSINSQTQDSIKINY